MLIPIEECLKILNESKADDKIVSRHRTGLGAIGALGGAIGGLVAGTVGNQFDNTPLSGVGPLATMKLGALGGAALGATAGHIKGKMEVNKKRNPVVSQ